MKARTVRAILVAATGLCLAWQATTADAAGKSGGGGGGGGGGGSRGSSSSHSSGGWGNNSSHQNNGWGNNSGHQNSGWGNNNSPPNHVQTAPQYTNQQPQNQFLKTPPGQTFQQTPIQRSPQLSNPQQHTAFFHPPQPIAPQNLRGPLNTGNIVKSGNPVQLNGLRPSTGNFLATQGSSAHQLATRAAVQSIRQTAINNTALNNANKAANLVAAKNHALQAHLANAGNSGLSPLGRSGKSPAPGPLNTINSRTLALQQTTALKSLPAGKQAAYNTALTQNLASREKHTRPLVLPLTQSAGGQGTAGKLTAKNGSAHKGPINPNKTDPPWKKFKPNLRDATLAALSVGTGLGIAGGAAEIFGSQGAADAGLPDCCYGDSACYVPDDGGGGYFASIDPGAPEECLPADGGGQGQVAQGGDASPSQTGTVAGGGGQGQVAQGGDPAPGQTVAASGQGQTGQNADGNVVAASATENTSSSQSVPVTAVLQRTRFLRVANAGKEKATLYLTYYTEDANHLWNWFPGASDENKPSSDALAFDLAPGEAADLTDGDWQINAAKVRIWGKSAGGKEWNKFKDQDLVLVPETDDKGDHLYVASEKQTFSFAVK